MVRRVGDLYYVKLKNGKEFNYKKREGMYTLIQNGYRKNREHYCYMPFNLE